MSNETDDAPLPDLYDFLYRDSERIASYYAQIWNGRLLSVEESNKEAERSEQGIKGDIQLASSESKTISDYQFETKKTVDMHDAATVDLLLRLTAERAERGMLGSIRSFSGTCFFLDRNILKYASPAIDFAAQQAEEAKKSQKTRQQRRREEQKSARDYTSNAAPIKALIQALDMPSGFVLITDELALCGPIKESGLDQPISSLLFRAGNFGLANTFVVGLVEQLGPQNITPFSPVHEAQNEMANTFFPLLFPSDALRVIPLVIYRKIQM